jgi:molybdenum cofactor cytidylyltransferase
MLADNLTSNKIIIPTYKNKPGNPVGFGSEFFGELKTLTGDSGARSVVGQHTEAAVKLEINDPAILWDVDTPFDLSRYQSRSS